MNREDDIESQLLNYIKEAEDKKEELRKDLEGINNKIIALTDRINNFKVTLQFHLEKIGKIEQGRFSNIKSLGKACEILIKEHGEMTPKQLLEELKIGGYNLKTKKTTQAIFFSVFKNPHIKRTEEGNYEWVENVAGEEL